MKPRIRIFGRLWYCFLPDWPRTRIIGMGFKPRDAYQDWKKLLKAMR